MRGFATCAASGWAAATRKISACSAVDLKPSSDRYIEELSRAPRGCGGEREDQDLPGCAPEQVPAAQIPEHGAHHDGCAPPEHHRRKRGVQAAPEEPGDERHQRAA